MARNGEVEEEEENLVATATTTTNTAAGTRARTDPFLVTCKCFSVITSLAAILCIAVNVLSAVRSFKNASDVRNQPSQFSIAFLLINQCC